jgi:hypothetical protein
LSALSLTIIDKNEPLAEEISKVKKGKMKKGATKGTKAKATGITKADASLAVTTVTQKNRGKKSETSQLQISTSHSVPEADDNPDSTLIARRPATISDYNCITEMFKKGSGLFKFLDNCKSDPEGNIDWSDFQTGKLWTPRSGPPSSLAKTRLETLAQFINYTVISIAHDDRISKEKAWELTGLLKAETRGTNIFNAFSHWRAGQLTAANGGVPGKHIWPLSTIILLMRFSS